MVALSLLYSLDTQEDEEGHIAKWKRKNFFCATDDAVKRGEQMALKQKCLNATLEYCKWGREKLAYKAYQWDRQLVQFHKW